jgi:hypothetical protein
MITDETRDKIIQEAIKNNITITDPNLYEAVYSTAMQVIDLTLIQVIRNVLEDE